MKKYLLLSKRKRFRDSSCTDSIPAIGSLKRNYWWQKTARRYHKNGVKPRFFRTSPKKVPEKGAGFIFVKQPVDLIAYPEK
jgi:hypothetical protein